VFLQSGEEPEDIFFLTKGYVRQYFSFESGTEITLEILAANTYFSVSPAIIGKPNNFSFAALTDCTVVKIPKDKFISFIKSQAPNLVYDFMSTILKRNYESMNRIEGLLTRGAYGKVISVLLYTAGHFGKKVGKTIIITLPLTHWELAELAGITRETASIVMEKLKTKKLIYYHGKTITIQNLRVLKQELMAPAKSFEFS